MAIMIAVGSGRCSRCTGLITRGSRYMREERDDGSSQSSHLVCPTTNGHGSRVSTSAPRGTVAATPAGRGEPWQRCCCCDQPVFAFGPARPDVRCSRCSADIAWRVALLRQGLKVVWT